MNTTAPNQTSHPDPPEIHLLSSVFCILYSAFCLLLSTNVERPLQIDYFLCKTNPKRTQFKPNSPSPKAPTPPNYPPRAIRNLALSEVEGTRYEIRNLALSEVEGTKYKPNPIP